jgi:hypothetical protein
VAFCFSFWFCLVFVFVFIFVFVFVFVVFLFFCFHVICNIVGKTADNVIVQCCACEVSECGVVVYHGTF